MFLGSVRSQGRLLAPLCFKFQSWCLKPRLIYAILLFSWPNSSLITRNWNFGVLRQKISDIKHLPASRHQPGWKELETCLSQFSMINKQPEESLAVGTGSVWEPHYLLDSQNTMSWGEKILVVGLVWWVWPSPEAGTAAVTTITYTGIFIISNLWL